MRCTRQLPGQDPSCGICASPLQTPFSSPRRRFRKLRPCPDEPDVPGQALAGTLILDVYCRVKAQLPPRSPPTMKGGLEAALGKKPHETRQIELTHHFFGVILCFSGEEPMLLTTSEIVMISVTYKSTSTWQGKQIACATIAPSFEVLNGRDMHRGGPTG